MRGRWHLHPLRIRRRAQPASFRITIHSNDGQAMSKLLGDYEIHCPICGPSATFRVKYDEEADVENLDFAARKLTRHMHWRMVQCNGCGLIYSNPIIDPEKIYHLYRETDFIVEKQLDLMGDDYIRELLAVADPASSPRMLEVGSANGFFLARALAEGFDAAGIEPGKAAVADAPTEVGARIVNDVLRTGLFPPESFDIVCSFQVFDHVLDPNDFLQLIRHYLKPGGKFVQIHHNITSFLPTTLGRRASTYDVEHIHLWSPDTMRKILSKNGFTTVRIDPVSSSYQLDHVIRQLPLPDLIKSTSRRALEIIGLSNLTLRVAVENMRILSLKA
jgi:SAM-dependent methyltransferase